MSFFSDLKEKIKSKKSKVKKNKNYEEEIKAQSNEMNNQRNGVNPQAEVLNTQVDMVNVQKEGIKDQKDAILDKKNSEKEFVYDNPLLSKEDGLPIDLETGISLGKVKKSRANKNKRFSLPIFIISFFLVIIIFLGIKLYNKTLSDKRIASNTLSNKTAVKDNSNIPNTFSQADINAGNNELSSTSDLNEGIEDSEALSPERNFNNSSNQDSFSNLNTSDLASSIEKDFSLSSGNGQMEEASTDISDNNLLASTSSVKPQKSLTEANPIEKERNLTESTTQASDDKDIKTSSMPDESSDVNNEENLKKKADGKNHMMLSTMSGLLLNTPNKGSSPDNDAVKTSSNALIGKKSPSKSKNSASSESKSSQPKKEVVKSINTSTASTKSASTASKPNKDSFSTSSGVIITSPNQKPSSLERYSVSAVSPIITKDNVNYEINNIMIMAQKQLKENKYAEALASYELIYKYKKDVEIEYNIIMLALRLENLDKVKNMFYSAVRLSEVQIRSLLQIMIEEGFVSEATEVANRSILKDDFGNIYYILGYLAELSNNYPDALNNYRKAMNRSNYDPYFTYAYARILDILGNTEEAIGYYRLVSSLAKDAELYKLSIGRGETLLKSFKIGVSN